MYRASEGGLYDLVLLKSAENSFSKVTWATEYCTLTALHYHADFQGPSVFNQSTRAMEEQPSSNLSARSATEADAEVREDIHRA